MKTMKRILSLVVVLMLVLLAVTPAFAASTPKLNKTKATISVGMTTTLKVSGTTWSEERETISETLSFWPQGNRTVSYPYGTLSSSYVITFRSFNVTGVSGSIFLLQRS